MSQSFHVLIYYHQFPHKLFIVTFITFFGSNYWKTWTMQEISICIGFSTIEIWTLTVHNGNGHIFICSKPALLQSGDTVTNQYTGRLSLPVHKAEAICLRPTGLSVCPRIRPLVQQRECSSVLWGSCFLFLWDYKVYLCQNLEATAAPPLPHPENRRSTAASPPLKPPQETAELHDWEDQSGNTNLRGVSQKYRQETALQLGMMFKNQ